MNIVAYYINLEDSKVRRCNIEENSKLISLEIIRIPALNGYRVSSEERYNFSYWIFSLINGRKLMPGEYGCYYSHVAALEKFVSDGHEAALILEDDVLLPKDLLQRCKSILKAVPYADVIKIRNHRKVGFIPATKTDMGDYLGYCLHGPHGSSAAYLVTRNSAIKLLRRLKPMCLPYDMMLELTWFYRTIVYVVYSDFIFPSEQAIHSRIFDISSKQKFYPLKRIPAYIFRSVDALARVIYALFLPIIHIVLKTFTRDRSV
ncbi:hypothetical protein B488_13160 [Liberibacter crescens BT-1]|uniref:Glycosyl transferase family 25 domain-containing protein n=1 Tax=Liberibacter crescens (strain BT-1) TaxID=1215343 RepID=L0EXB5_LIBCB|nr:glycosyltransferase family 25 protein [Liberibacter crescens]AGA65308.1 hypothetical protein B488_13160 [Liberibacter crescens BT-1]